MASVNRVTVIGNCGRDAELRYMPNGNAVTNVSVACSEKWKDKESGEQREHTEWIRLSFFGKLAEVAGEYLKKGSPVYIEGKMRTREWEKNGEKRYSTEVHVDNMQLLGSRNDRAQRGDDNTPAERSTPAQKRPAGSIAGMDDDIPFASLGHGKAWRVI